MLSKLSHKLYIKVGIKYPKAMRMYLRYKNHNEAFHLSNKRLSRRYLFRLIRAEKQNKDLYRVKPPLGAFTPYLTYGKEEKKEKSEPIYAVIPDSKLLSRKSPEELARELCEFDVVSFDVFDTLIFRPFAIPSDLFYLIEAKTECFNFSELRVRAEQISRVKTKKPNFEVDIYDIYEEFSRLCPLKKEDAEIEIELEKEVCYANPYMRRVFEILKSKGQKTVVTSDMYLPQGVIEEILKKNGFYPFDAYYISCERGFNKGSGKLFDLIKKDFDGSIVHVGDSLEADVQGAARAKVASYHYQQCNAYGNIYRPPSLISPVSSLYKGIVNNYMYNGLTESSAREDFGFIYAGPVVAGFCEWINKFSAEKSVDKILFLARDMDIFYKIYNRHYKKFDNEYVITSRFSLQETIVKDYPDEFFHHTVRARCDRGYTIEQAFSEINLAFLCDECEKFHLHRKDVIVSAKMQKIENMFLSCIDKIAEHFRENELAAMQYFKEKIGKGRRILAVDLGWRGSILAYLKFLLIKKWKLCDEVYGALLGSTVNTTSVNLVSEGIVTSFAYNHVYNRDLLAKGDWETEYIRLLTLESVFSSGEPSLIEYRLDRETNKTVFLYSDANPNKSIIAEFQAGITKFVDIFEAVRKKFPRMYPMTAVDAMEAIISISQNYDYIARIIGDIMDTPYAIAGINVNIRDYVPLGELMVERKMIKEWPIK